jgi:dienelactone hydrolase
MASTISDPSPSKALVVHDSTLPVVPIRTPLEETTDEVFRRSLEIAKHDASLFPQIASNFTGRHFVSISNMTLSPPEGLGTDPSIGVEIIRPTTTDPNPPVIIFSHGMGVSPAHYRPLLGELASHGYVVISLSHPSGVEDLDVDGAERAARVAPIMANNIQFVLQLVRSGKLIGDAGQIVLAGHSIGGAASVLIAQNDPHVAGCVNIDGWLEGSPKPEGLEQPFLLLRGDYEELDIARAKSSDERERAFAVVAKRKDDELEAFFRHSLHAKKLMIPGAKHMDFSDTSFQEYLAGKQSLDSAMRVHVIASRAMLDFLRSTTR